MNLLAWVMDNSHFALLQGVPGVCFDETGPASSAQTCNDANNNNCTIVGAGELNCKVDSAP
jgi:hypothetical protein